MTEPTFTPARNRLPTARIHRRAAVAAIAALSLGLAGTAAGSESWRVSSGDMRARCRLTVGGSFDAATSEISGSLRPEAREASRFSGALRVDLGTLDTGIGLRNAHLRDTYLEVDRGETFRMAVLADIRLGEPFPAGSAAHGTTFSGTILLHGVERPVTGETELSRTEGRVRIKARFSLRLDDFDIPPPRYMGVGVRDEVGIEVELEVTVEGVPEDAGS